MKISKIHTQESKDTWTLPGAHKALMESRRMYPSYDLLLEQHNERFKVKEKLKSFGL